MPQMQCTPATASTSAQHIPIIQPAQQARHRNTPCANAKVTVVRAAPDARPGAQHLLEEGGLATVELSSQGTALPGVGGNVQLIDDAARAGVAQQPHHLALEGPHDACSGCSRHWSLTKTLATQHLTCPHSRGWRTVRFFPALQASMQGRLLIAFTCLTHISQMHSQRNAAKLEREASACVWCHQAHVSNYMESAQVDNAVRDITGQLMVLRHSAAMNQPSCQ